jgi:transcriptional regulator with XRE-family HTH domain
MSVTTDDHIGRRLRQRRLALGLTQREVAAAVGVRFQQIHKYECGLNGVSAARLWRLSLALQAPMAFFFEGLRDDVRAADSPADGVRAAPTRT